MNILLSLSAVTPVITAGSRVAVEFGKDDWSIGTVRKIVPTGTRVDFDYGAENTLIKLNKIVLVNRKASLKKVLTRAQVKALEFPKLVVKAKPKQVVKPTVAVPVLKKRVLSPVKVVPLPEITIKVPEPVREIEHTPNLPEERKLERLVGDTNEFESASRGTTKNKHDYLVKVWTRANVALFDNKLVMPHFQMLKVMRQVKGLGSWTAAKRLLKISPRLFNATQAHAITVIVHEICHQAVSEIDRLHSAVEGHGGHGPTWSKWMRHCGLEPDRYNKDDADTFLTTEEQRNLQKVKSNFDLARSQSIRVNPKTDYPAKWHNPLDDTWHKGLIVGRHDLQGKRWTFIENANSLRWHNVPSGLFYELDAHERAQYTSPDFKEASMQIRQHQAEVLKQKRDARTAKKNPFDKYNVYGVDQKQTPDDDDKPWNPHGSFILGK